MTSHVRHGETQRVLRLAEQSRASADHKRVLDALGAQSRFALEWFERFLEGAHHSDVTAVRTEDEAGEPGASLANRVMNAAVIATQLIAKEKAHNNRDLRDASAQRPAALVKAHKVIPMLSTLCGALFGPRGLYGQYDHQAHEKDKESAGSERLAPSDPFGFLAVCAECAPRMPVPRDIRSPMETWSATEKWSVWARAMAAFECVRINAQAVLHETGPLSVEKLNVQRKVITMPKKKRISNTYMKHILPLNAYAQNFCPPSYLRYLS